MQFWAHAARREAISFVSISVSKYRIGFSKPHLSIPNYFIEKYIFELLTPLTHEPCTKGESFD